MKLIFSFVFISFVSNAIFAQGKLGQPKIPKDNPQTKTKIELGKQLYFDPRLSSSGAVSCNSCHNVMAGGDDGRAFSAGIMGKLGGRSSPTVFNSAYYSVLFWDGRASSLEEQAKGPMINPVEMGMKDHGVVVSVIKEIPEYISSFKSVFGGDDAVTIDNAAKAIAAYERTLVSNKSAYDLCRNGQKKSCRKEAVDGLQIAQAIGCMSCHSGPHFSGPPLPEGVGFYQKFPTYAENPYVSKYKFLEDQGRFEVTKKEEDKNMWRVPTWRNVAITAPYFHNGSVETLDLAVRIMAKTQLNLELTDDQVEKIVAFLASLTCVPERQFMPKLPVTVGKSVILEKRL